MDFGKTSIAKRFEKSQTRCKKTLRGSKKYKICVKNLVAT